MKSSLTQVLLLIAAAMLTGLQRPAQASGWVDGKPPTYNGVAVQDECVVFVEKYSNLVLGEPMNGIGQYHPYSATDPYNSDGAHWVWDDSRLQPVGSQRIANNGSSNYPQGGDIIIFSASYPGSGGYGHAAIVDSASSRDKVNLVESNYTYHESGDQRTIGIDGYVLGWFRKSGAGNDFNPPPPGLPLAIPKVGYNADHRIVVGMRGINGHIYTIEQTYPGADSWQGLQDHGGNVYGNPVFGRDHTGAVEIFIQGTDSQVWNLWQNSPNGFWASAPAPFVGTNTAGDPAVVCNQDGRIEFFWVDGSGHPQTNWETTTSGGVSWHGQSAMPGTLSPMLAATQNLDGRIELIGRGTDSAFYNIWQTSQNGSWSGWAWMQGNVPSRPVLAMDQFGRLETFALGGDGHIYYQWQLGQNNETYGGWYQVPNGNGLQSSPAVATMNGQLTIFVRGGDNSIYYASEPAVSSWTGWQSLHCSVSSDPAVGVNADGTLYVFARGNDGNLWYTRQSSSGWSVWGTLGGTGSLF